MAKRKPTSKVNKKATSKKTVVRTKNVNTQSEKVVVASNKNESKIVNLFGETVGYVIFIIIAFEVVPKLSFITKDYIIYLPIAFWATSISFVFKSIKHLSSLHIVKKICEVGDLSASLYSTYWLLIIYPFDFSKVAIFQVSKTFPFALKVAIAAMTFGIFVNFLKIFLPEKSKS